YVTDKSNPRFKGDDYWIDPLPRPLGRSTLELARLKCSGNWNPEPAGWTRMGNVLYNENHIVLKTYPVDCGLNNFTPRDYAIAHLTNTGPVELTSQQEEALKKYLDAGGFLVFDAAGGSVDANLSMDTLMKRLYPAASIAWLPDNHEIYSTKFGGSEI